MTKLYDITDFCKKGYEIEDYPYIGTVDVKAEIGTAIKIGNKYYVFGIIAADRTKAGVREEKLNLKRGTKHEYENEFVCPCCKHIDHDSFELDDNGIIECGNCGATIEYERVVTVEWNTELITPPDVVSGKWVK